MWEINLNERYHISAVSRKNELGVVCRQDYYKNITLNTKYMQQQKSKYTPWYPTQPITHVNGYKCNTLIHISAFNLFITTNKLKQLQKQPGCPHHWSCFLRNMTMVLLKGTMLDLQVPDRGASGSSILHSHSSRILIMTSLITTEA